MTQGQKKPAMKFVDARERLEQQKQLMEQAEKTARMPKPTDDELADELAARWDGNYRYFRNAWHTYHAGYWKQLKNISRPLKAFMIEKKAVGINPTRNKASSLEWFLQADLEFEDDSAVDNYPQYISMQNGLFNLDTFELEPHRRDVYFTSQLSFAYDPDADCPTFRHFMKTALVDSSGVHDTNMGFLFLEALGYTLTADTSFKTSFWLVGPSGSGKSTAIGLVRDLMGAMHVTIDLNQLATNRFLLAQVAGKRALTFTESNVNSVLADGNYKTLVGGEDEISADVKNKEPISFKPQVKVWWAMNEMPRVLDRSDAVYGRVIIFPFNFVPNGKAKDMSLSRKLREECSGIFNLALIGLKRLRHAGKFTTVEQVEAIRESYRIENDTEAAYIDERCTIGAELFVQSSTLYSDYKLWCENNGFRAKNRNQVAKEWQRLGFNQTRRKDAIYWAGVGVKP